MTAPHGFLLLDKPAGWSSHRVVSRVRKWLGTRKVGHAGTLDPMATGLLIIGVGPSTRLLTFAVGLGKTYTATVRLGAATPTDDADSPADRFGDPSALADLDLDRIDEALGALRGDIMQSPSAVSAIKVDGRRAYARVRAGEDVELAARPVTVSRFDPTSSIRCDTLVDEAGSPHRVADVDVVVECSSGTYVRALARDLGDALGVHGHLTALRRTHVGHYSVDEALAVPDFEETAPSPDLLAPATAAAALLPVLAVSPQQAASLRQGQFIDDQSVVPPDASEPFAAVVRQGEFDGDDSRRDDRGGDHPVAHDLVAIVDRRGSAFAPRVVFPA
ncbi:tRNA pseudouridine(55) synthase TruB [Brevibacterium yomogidense]|uniref:tRNA pseudouridine(55) synthase TruB n=1 Tax=Brevibacterium yomogidense TaxID=946573 RepID=UPI0018E0207F